MHEWALAEALISTASQIAEREGLQEITEVKIKVGELQNVEIDILNFALSQLKTAKFRKTRFNIEVVKAKLTCRVCGHQWLFGEERLDEKKTEAIHFLPEIVHTYIRCPRCASPDFEVTQGRGVWLEGLKGMK